jgi:hypothetical protein
LDKPWYWATPQRAQAERPQASEKVPGRHSSHAVALDGETLPGGQVEQYDICPALEYCPPEQARHSED